jgi:hypothetical protein
MSSEGAQLIVDDAIAAGAGDSEVAGGEIAPAIPIPVAEIWYVALAEIDVSPVSTRTSTFSDPVLPASILSALVAVSGVDCPAARLTAPDGRTVPPGPVEESAPPPHAKRVTAATAMAVPLAHREIIIVLVVESRNVGRADPIQVPPMSILVPVAPGHERLASSGYVRYAPRCRILARRGRCNTPCSILNTR